jgi:protein O-GlcNAc transferase
MTDRDRFLQCALDRHRSENLQEAATFYEEILRSHPDQPDALYLLGCVAYQSGDNVRACELFRKALTTAPDQPRYYHALGLALMRLDRFDEAETNLLRAIALADLPEFKNSLGVLQARRGRLTEALAAYRQALEQDPRFADAHYNLGNAHRSSGALAEAIESFRRAVELNPADAQSLAALGKALRSAKRNADAVALLGQAASLLPQDAELHCDLGDALQELSQLPEAITAYQSALKLDPHLARAWYTMGCAQNRRQEYLAAIACFQNAIDLEPDWLEARHNLAQALFQIGQVSEAMAHFRDCAARDRERSGLSRAMIALIIPGVSEADNAEILSARRTFVEKDLLHLAWESSVSSRATPSHQGLRIGYLSSFFHHPNWMKPVWGLINQHDRQQFEIHLFSEAPASRIEYGYRTRPEDHFHDVSSLSNQALGALIRKCELDLLIDLNGYSRMHRLPLFTLRPAPITVGWFNLYATTGMTSFDYLIGDDEVIPTEEEPFYSERICRVPGSYLTFEVNYPVPEVVAPPCLTNGRMTFGSLASQYKITNEVVAAWSRILRQSPTSLLALKNQVLGSPASREFVHRLFERNGIARERVRLEGPADHFQFLRMYDEIDLALDTFPYNGGTTTTEAIWQGVPVLSFWGDRWVSRTSASILRAADLGEFVVRDLEEYVSFASQLAGSPNTWERLARLRRGMRSQLLNSPVCDTHTFAREMEQIYRRICRGDLDAEPLRE